MAGSVRIYGYIAGWRHRVRRFGSECDGVRRNRIMICPLNRTAGVDHNFRLEKTHHRHGFVSATVAYNLAHSRGDCAVRLVMMMLTSRQIRRREEILGLLGGFFVVERLVMW